MYQMLTRTLCGLMMLFVMVGCANISSKKSDLSSGSYYRVRKGDTLYSIGLRSSHGYKRLATWNGIKPPYKIYQGQRLKLFSGHQFKKSLSKKKATKTKVKKIIVKQRPKFYWHWPIKGKLLKSFKATGRKGIDISGHVGQKIRAVRAGVVVYSGSSLSGYGKLLIIKHDSVYLSAYAHNRKLLVVEGKKVRAGQYIAEMGVGLDTLPLLHFEIRKNGKPVNPLNYLLSK